MKHKTKKFNPAIEKQKLSSHTIPTDLFPDVVKILLTNEIRWQLEAVNDHDNSYLIQVSIQPELSRHRHAMKNIQEILTDYGFYLSGNPADHQQERLTRY